MNDPPRLRDQSNNPLISEMLSAAGRQEPRPRAVHSTLLAAATAASVVGGQATAGAAMAGTTAAALTKLAVKWTLLSAVVVGGGVAGVESSGVLRDQGVTASAGARAHSDTPSRQAAPAQTRERASAENIAALPEAVTAEPAPRPPPVPVSAPPGQTARQPIAVRSEQLEREVALLDEARSALGRERYADVRRISERYLRDYPSGRLEQEARYLGMQAAHHQGDRARAEAEARALLELNPNGPHAKAAREVYALDE